MVSLPWFVVLLNVYLPKPLLNFCHHFHFLCQQRTFHQPPRMTLKGPLLSLVITNIQIPVTGETDTYDNSDCPAAEMHGCSDTVDNIFCHISMWGREQWLTSWMCVWPPWWLLWMVPTIGDQVTCDLKVRLYSEESSERFVFWLVVHICNPSS